MGGNAEGRVQWRLGGRGGASSSTRPAGEELKEEISPDSSIQASNVPDSPAFKDQLKPPGVGRGMDRTVSQLRRSKAAAVRLFELLWNVVAIFFLLQILQSSAHIPQHDGTASSLIEQTKVWVSGDREGSAFGQAVDKATLIDTLNSTVLLAMFKTHITHVVFHFNCDKHKRRRLPSLEEDEHIARKSIEPDSPLDAGLPLYPTGPNIRDSTTCEDIPFTVPHRAGMWMFIVSRDDVRNQVGCQVKHDVAHEPKLNVPWSEQYDISGQLGTYSLPNKCTSSANFEIMGREDNPDPANSNALAEWLRQNFQWHTQALIILTQLWWEPELAYDTFGTLIVEQDRSGLIRTSQFYKARHYGADARVSNLSLGAKVATVLMLLFFAWWCGALTASLRPMLPRIVFVALYPLPYLEAYTGHDYPSLLLGLLSLPLLAWGLLCLAAHTFRWRVDVLRTGAAYPEHRMSGAELTRHCGKDLLVLLAVWAAALYYSQSQWAGVSFVIFALWLCHLIVGIGFAVVKYREGSMEKLAWQVVDSCILGCAVWMFVSFATFVSSARSIRQHWSLSSETAAFFASRGTLLELPFSLVLFLIVVRMLRYLEIFPILAVPWGTFTRALHEMLAYSVVFILLIFSFSLLFVYNLGGDATGVSGVGRAFLELVPGVFGNDVPFFSGGAPNKRVMVLLMNFFYEFCSVFFVSNILLAVVLDHYSDARKGSRGVWVDEHLISFLHDRLDEARKVAPEQVKGVLDTLEERLERAGSNITLEKTWAYPEEPAASDPHV